MHVRAWEQFSRAKRRLLTALTETASFFRMFHYTAGVKKTQEWRSGFLEDALVRFYSLGP
jgi:hypothetical protein